MNTLFVTSLALFFSTVTVAVPLDYYQILNHLDNYGNLDLRNKPYSSLPDGLTVKGNLNIGSTTIKNLPKDLSIEGSLEASNSQLATVYPGTSIKGYANLLGSQIKNWPAGITLGDI